MRRRLRTKYGRKKYKLRQTTVEPVFGIIKEQFGLRQFPAARPGEGALHVAVYLRCLQPHEAL
jgi:hypothetical protein